MTKHITLKSLSMASAVAAALAFGSVGYAQAPVQPQSNDSKMPAPATGDAAKTTGERDNAKMNKKSTKAGKVAAKKADTTSTQGTNAGTSKSGDTTLPATKGDGSGKS
jgi:cytoskeletal protein RodZ